jgi:hypothetical protein
LRERVESVVKDYYAGVRFHDPAREKLAETRKTIVAQWMAAADILDTQGEVALAGDVRFFANHLPQVLTDRQRLAVDYVRHLKRSKVRDQTEVATRQRDDLTR